MSLDPKAPSPSIWVMAFAIGAGSALRSLKFPSGNTFSICSLTNWPDVTGSMRQLVGQGERNSTKAYPFPSLWISSALRTAFLACMMRLVSETETRSMNTGASSWFKHLAHLQRVAFLGRVTAERRGGGLLPEHGGRGHLPAGHGVDGVVDEEAGEMLTAVGGLEGVVEADRPQVPVALVGDDDLVRKRSWRPRWPRPTPVRAVRPRSRSRSSR